LCASDLTYYVCEIAGDKLQPGFIGMKITNQGKYWN